MVFSGTLVAGATISQYVAVARAAEECGYESGWITEVAGCDAVTALAATAGATSRLTLATGILPIYARDPYLMAMTLSTLQEYSGGRIVAGFGTSTPAIITGWHGLPFERPIEKTRAYVEIVRRFLAGERVKAEGEYTIRGASMRPVKQPVPIYLGTLNDRMLELAGEIADGVILNFPTPGYTEHALAVIARGLAKAGRDRSAIDVCANFRTGVGAWEGLANSLRRELISYFTAPVYRKVWGRDGWAAEIERVTALWDAGDRAGAVAAISDEFTDAHGVIGASVAECRAKVRRFLDLGVDHAVLFPIFAEGAGGNDGFLGAVRAFGPRAAG
jgi:probable F420-dependent oxidoreductase